MPCRPQLCQRLAAQLSHHPPPPLSGNNHIWISDELLSEAFNRYARVSHATRRYGSNVPGPLEARRRASKRRMGCAVAATSMGPPGGDFGALFGPGAGAGSNTAENNWTWKAAGTQPAKRVRYVSSPLSWAVHPSKLPPEWDQLLELPRSGQELVEESQIKFERLLHNAGDTIGRLFLNNAEDIQMLEEPDVAPLSSFLTSSADEPEAKNVTRLVTWLSGRSVSTTAWQVITALICDKIKLATISDEELLEIIRKLPDVLAWEEHESARQQLHQIFTTLSKTLADWGAGDGRALQAIFEGFHKTTQDTHACSGLVEILASTVSYSNAEVLSDNITLTMLAMHSADPKSIMRSRLLSQLASTLNDVPSVITPEVLKLSTRKVLGEEAEREPYVFSLTRYTSPRVLTWLACLASNAHFDRHMPLVYAELARRLRPYHIADHFYRTKSDDIARLLLWTWLPNTDLHNMPSTDEENRPWTRMPGFKLKQLGLREFSDADSPAIAEEFERLCARNGTDGSQQRSNTWLNMLLAFVRTGVSYEMIARDILDVCKARYPPKKVFKLFRDIINHPELDLSTNFSIGMIEYCLAEKENLLAWKVFHDVPSIVANDVPDLVFALIEDRSVAFDLFALINRQPDPIPLEHRTRPNLSVTPAQIGLVNLVAHAIATSESLRPSQAYHRVWALYRWLQDRGAPLDRLMSRSFVTAGILRPIKNHVWVSDERLEYILDIVEKVEGIETRKQVEALTIHMRRQVHDKVLALRQAVFEARWMKGWMKRTSYEVKSERFRIKKWTRQKPVPTRDRRSFIVPHHGEEQSKRSEEPEDMPRSSREDGAVVPRGGGNKSKRSGCELEDMPCSSREAGAVVPRGGGNKSKRSFSELEDMLSDSLESGVPLAASPRS